MARKTKPLTDTEIKAAKPKATDYQLYDGDGLTLLIKSSGSKLWQFRYYRPLTKQRTKQSFGAYPAISLSDARKLRAESRVLLAKDIDPQEHQKEQVRNSQEAKTNTFLLVAQRWWNVKKASVTEAMPTISGAHLREIFFQQSVISVSLRLRPILWLKQCSRSRPEVH